MCILEFLKYSGKLWFRLKITNAKITHHMTTRVFIQRRVLVGSSYATPNNDDITQSASVLKFLTINVNCGFDLS